MEFDLVCTLENTQSFIDELTSIKWKRQQEAVMELSEHGLMVAAEELNCLHARAYFRKELFLDYVYRPHVRLRFGISLTLLIDTLSAFSSASAASSPILTLRYPGPDNQLLLKMSDPANSNMSIGAEICTLIPDVVPRDWALHDGASVPADAPVSFAIRSSTLKELMEDLEWPGAPIRVSINPQPPGVTLLAQGHGDLEIELLLGRSSTLFIDFRCHRHVSHMYSYKHLSAVTANIPNAALKDNHGSKLTIDCNGLLRVQHIVNLRAVPAAGARASTPGAGGADAGTPRAPAFSQQAYPSQDEGGGGHLHRSSKTSYVEFYVAPQEDLEGNQGPIDEA